MDVNGYMIARGMDAVAVITDIHANLPALEAALARIDELGIERDLLRRRPRRLRPASQRGLRADRRARRSRRSTATTTTPSRRDLEDCGCAYITPHDRELGQQSVDWTLAHTDQASQGLHARAAVRPALRGRRRPTSTSSTARRARSTSTCSRTSRPASTSASPPPRPTRCSSSATPTSRGSHEYGGVLFVNCGSVGKPKDGDPRGALRGPAAAHRRRRRGRRSSASPTTPRPSPREVAAVRAAGRVRRQARDRRVRPAEHLNGG